MLFLKRTKVGTGATVVTVKADLNFITDIQSTVAQPTTGPVQNNVHPDELEPASPPSAQVFPVFGSPQGSDTHTASSSNAAGTGGVQWATPPSEQDSDADELPPRFRTLSNLYDTTEEIQNYEYSGVCLLTAD
jgi:hypothetical protein